MRKKHVASSNPHPPHSRAYDRATLGYSAGYSAGSTGGLLQLKKRQNPLASRSGTVLSGIYWRAALAGYSAGSTGEQLWRDTGPLASCSGGILSGIHWRDTWRDPLACCSWCTRRDPLASYSGGTLPIHCRATLAYSTGILGYSAGSTSEPLWQDTWRDRQAALARYSPGSTGGLLWLLWRDTRRNPTLAYSTGMLGYSAGSTGEPLWQDTWRDRRAALAGYSAGSTGGLLWWDTRRDPLASRSGTLGGIHWRAAHFTALRLAMTAGPGR